MKNVLVALLAAALTTPAFGGAYNAASGSPAFDDTREPKGPEPHFPWRPGQRSQYGYFQCTARDAGWEEHRVAHLGYGSSAGQAQQNALAHCQRLHGTCEVGACFRIQ